MTYPRRHLHEDETIIAERGLHVVRLLPKLVSAALVFAGLGAGFFLWKNSPSWFGLILGVVFVITLAYVFVKILHYRSTQLILTTQRLISRSGIFRRASKDIPLISIVDVTTVMPLHKRAIGLGDLVIHTISEHEPTTFIDLRRPKELADLLHSAREHAEQNRALEVMTKDEPINVAKEYQRLVALNRKGVLTKVEFDTRVSDLGMTHKVLSEQEDLDTTK